MYKKCKVIILPTNEKIRLFTGGGSLNYLNHAVDDGEGWRKPHHLYFTSDEEIKEGDWCIDSNNIIYKHENGKSFSNYFNANKIIATTDKHLETSDEVFHNTFKQNLPQPPLSFIERFIEEYNNGNKIKEVMVEYEEKYVEPHKSIHSNRGVFVSKLKINPKDNTIIIKSLKDKWNRKEVEQSLIYCVSELAAEFGVANTSTLMKDWNEATRKWIQKNLN